MKRYLNRNIWIVNIILFIFIILSASLLGSYLYDYVCRSDYEIDLYKKSYSKTSSDVNSIDRYNLITNIELFKTMYSNDKGEITVRSDNGEKVLAPGTEGSCVFSVKNTSDKNLDYKMEINGDIDNHNGAVPLQMCIVKGRYETNENMNWKNISSIDENFSMKDLNKGEDIDYTIYWRWPYDQDIDFIDTSLGDVTVSQDLAYTVEITTIAQESINQNTPLINRISHALKTGDNTMIMIWIVLMIVSFVLVKVGYKKHENQ